MTHSAATTTSKAALRDSGMCGLGSAEEWADYCVLNRECVEAPREPIKHCRPLSDCTPVSLLTAYVGEGSSLSRAYFTACSKVIARPRSRASSKGGSLRTACASATARSRREGSGW